MRLQSRTEERHESPHGKERDCDSWLEHVRDDATLELAHSLLG